MNKPVQRQFERTTLRRLRGLGRRLRLYVLLDGLAVFSLAATAAVLITLMVDYSTRLTWDMRLTQLTTLLMALAALAWWKIVRPLRTPLHLDHLALLIERRYPQLQSVLASAVEFVRHPAGSAGSQALAESVVRQAHQETSGLRFAAVLAHDRARRRAGVALFSIAVIAGLSLAAGDTMNLWLQRNVLLQDVAWPQRNSLTVENLVDGRIIVPRQEDVTVSAVVDRGFEPPRQVFIEFESPSGQHGREQMPAMSHREVRFTHTFERLTQSQRCRITGGDAVTEFFDLQVVDRPQIKAATIEVRPPAYTRLEPYRLRTGQVAADVLNGSEVRFRVESNKPLVRAALVREENNRDVEIGEAAAEDRDRICFGTTVKPQASSTYQFQLQDEIGLSNRGERTVPLRFSIRLIADKPPTVKMQIKDVGDMLTRQAILPIEASFSDQYGLATAQVAFEIAREGASSRPAPEPVAGFEPGTRTFDQTVQWHAERHEVAEGDRLTLYCQASDYDDVGGPNVGKSPVVFLRVVSQEELLAELSRREQEHRRDFERLLRQQEELYSDLLATSRPADPVEAREYFPRLARRQRDHAGRLNLLRLQFEQVLSKLRINQLATPAVEARLGQGVIEPMDELYRSGMPRAAAALEQIPPDAAGQVLSEARAAQELVLADMNRILASLLKWEGYQEAVTLLREIMKMQKSLEQETESKVEEQILGIPLERDQPTSGASPEQ